MHELNSCSGSRLGCEKSLQTGCDCIGTGEIGAVFELANVKCLDAAPISSPPVQLLQYLSFLPAIFRGLRQKLRRALR